MIETTIQGIPCVIQPTHVEPFVPECRKGHPDSWTPAEGGYAEYEVMDRNGRKAPWLEAKMDDEDDKRIQGLILGSRD